MNKREAKEKIKKLIDRYEKLTQAEINKMNEATTRKDFIIPLFEALGWDVYNHHEVVEEQSVVEGAVDYSFKLNKITQFLLEAKALKIDLEKIEYWKQAVDYAWNMGVDWGILSNFEGLKLFNAEEYITYPRLIKEFTYKEYLTKFDELWILSKESFQNEELDKKSQEWGAKVKKTEVTEKLAKDLMKWRDELFTNLSEYNKNKKEEEIDEAVQRILDRLIFIRSCEDRKIEEKKIWPAFQKWENTQKANDNFVRELKPIFKYYNDQYNSNLFTPHFCEELDTGGEPFHKIISDLYNDEKTGVRYNFAIIRPDVLGAVYEQYLGHILRKSKKKNDNDKSKTKRKEQGIYYTPTFIVDYIVENTLGELVRGKSLDEIQNLKILDPACGSGSFLIKAFDIIDNTLKELRRPKDASDNMHRKYGILSNIYGVDLDEQAIEITRLNLLLKAIEPNYKLPYLSNNTKVGNSLISGTEQELKKYFGSDWKNKEVFNWEQEFPEVFKGSDSGFDVIIGNPPYVSFYSRESHLDLYKNELNWLIENYEFTQKYDDRRLNTIMFFMEKSLKLLRDGGYLGFIVDANFIEKPSRAVRKFIEDRNVEIKISKKISVFKGVGSDQVIVIIKNQKLKTKEPIDIIDFDPSKRQFSILKKTLNRKDFRNDTLNLNIGRLVLDTQCRLSDIAEISTGVQIGIGGTRMYRDRNITDLFYSNKEVPGFYKNISLDSNKFFRYSSAQIKNYINLNERLAYKINKSVAKCNIAVTKAEDFKDRDKIFIRQSSDKITATLGYKGQVCEYSAFVLKTKKSSDLKYILALLNSRLLSFYALQENIILTGAKKQPQIRIKGLESLPVPMKTSPQDEKNLSSLSIEMLEMNKELQKTTKNSDKWEKIKSEIEKIDKIIDQKVYKLYGLTSGEIKIIEDFNK